MTPLAALLLIVPALALLNRVRGMDISGARLWASLALVLVVAMLLKAAGYALLLIAVYSAACGAGFFLWAALGGWGKYFAAFHGRGRGDEKEAFYADFVAGVFQSEPRTPADWRRFGVAGMCARGLVGSIPLFAAITAVPLVISADVNWAALAGIPLMAMQGFIYGAMRHVPERYATEIAEVITGAWMGLLIAGALWSA